MGKMNRINRLIYALLYLIIPAIIFSLGYLGSELLNKQYSTINTGLNGS